MKKNLTLKLEVTQLSEYANFAKSLNMSRSEMVRTAINEFVQKQKPQAS
jgi:metal-responsive CopG/Arc/MetJ family transcriptional regulator